MRESEDFQIFEDRNREVIEDAKLKLEEEYGKKDLKEKRGFIKEHFYKGGKKQI